jgi:hypothetical protein
MVLSLSVSTASDLEPVPVLHTETDDATEIAEAWFHRLYGFDALMAFESRHGEDYTHFQVARRWVDGRAELVFDVLEPAEFGKYAALLLHNSGSSDDLFLYVPSVQNAPILGRRVRRLSAVAGQNQVFLERVSLGDMSPITYGELEYALLREEELSGELCWVIEGRPRHRGIAFDKIVLAISQESRVALRTEFYEDERLTRRVSIAPRDIGYFGDQMIPTRRTIEVPHMDGMTELTLKNILLDPTFPDRLFSQHNLQVQRFPHF